MEPLVEELCRHGWAVQLRFTAPPAKEPSFWEELFGIGEELTGEVTVSRAGRVLVSVPDLQHNRNYPQRYDLAEAVAEEVGRAALPDVPCASAEAAGG